MDGLNVLFSGNPIPFLKYNLLHPNPAWGLETHVADPRDLETGLQSFDILKPDEGSHGIHQLKFYDRGAQHLHGAKVENFQKTFQPGGRPDSFFDKVKGTVEASRKSDEGPIMAFWLPFKMNRTYEMDLDASANFFFTAGLSGCTVVVSGDPQHPHAAHINRMENTELQSLMDRFRPKRNSMDPLGVQNMDGGYEDLRPAPTKAETTTRQTLMQEIKAAAAARAAGTSLRGNNYQPRRTGAVQVGGPKATGTHIFGVVDFALHYEGPTALDATANVVGIRNTATGNWHFVYQVFGSTGHNYYQREPLRCVVCKLKVDNCTCAP
jgi:hypothetical protein